jgi:predicted nucleotidyltransferase
MDKQQTLALLSRSKPGLQSRFGVVRLGLFGSAARDAATDRSDIDVLVAFDGPATSKRYFGVMFYLEDLLGGTAGTIDCAERKLIFRRSRFFSANPIFDMPQRNGAVKELQ